MRSIEWLRCRLPCVTPKRLNHLFKLRIFNRGTHQISWRSRNCQPLPRYLDFWIFQHGGRPPYWICDACVGTTHEGHLVVFITVQKWLESMQ